jgi:hypothetical protein
MSIKFQLAIEDSVHGFIVTRKELTPGILNTSETIFIPDDLPKPLKHIACTEYLKNLTYFFTTCPCYKSELEIRPNYVNIEWDDAFPLSLLWMKTA